MRVGLGIDVHAFAEAEAGRSLILGGVSVPHSRGLKGHSDADVLTHAVMDALLGAARLGDIGKHFPDIQSVYKDISSLQLLKRVKQLLDQEGWQIEDLDCVIIAEQPRLSPYRDEMRATLAQTLCLDTEHIGVKATTSEHLGFEGREEGISAYVVALLKPQE